MLDRHQQFWLIKNIDVITIPNTETIQGIRLNNVYLLNGQIRKSNSNPEILPTQAISRIFKLSINHNNHNISNPFNWNHEKYHLFLSEISKYFINAHIDHLQQEQSHRNEINSLQSHSHSHLRSRPYETIFILLFSTIVLPIATMFGAVFEMQSREFGFNDIINVLNNELELAKSGLNNNECCFDCDVLSCPTNNTDTPVFNCGPIGVGLAVNNDIGFDLIATLTATMKLK